MIIIKLVPWKREKNYNKKKKIVAQDFNFVKFVFDHDFLWYLNIKQRKSCGVYNKELPLCPQLLHRQDERENSLYLRNRIIFFIWLAAFIIPLLLFFLLLAYKVWCGVATRPILFMTTGIDGFFFKWNHCQRICIKRLLKILKLPVMLRR